MYKSYRNKLTSVLRKSEKDYYVQKLDSVKGNLAKTWKVLNAITSRHTQSSVVDEIVYNNSIIKDPKQIANKFNDFFVNVGPTLAKKYPMLQRTLNSSCRQVIRIPYSLNLLMMLKLD